MAGRRLTVDRFSVKTKHIKRMPPLWNPGSLSSLHVFSGSGWGPLPLNRRSQHLNFHPPPPVRFSFLLLFALVLALFQAKALSLALPPVLALETWPPPGCCLLAEAFLFSLNFCIPFLTVDLNSSSACCEMTLSWADRSVTFVKPSLND